MAFNSNCEHGKKWFIWYLAGLLKVSSLNLQPGCWIVTNPTLLHIVTHPYCHKPIFINIHGYKPIISLQTNIHQISSIVCYEYDIENQYGLVGCYKLTIVINIQPNMV